MKAKYQDLTALTWGGRHENEPDEQRLGESETGGRIEMSGSEGKSRKTELGGEK